MRSKRTRLDRYLSAQLGISRRDVRPILAAGRVLVDEQAATGIGQYVDEFTRVTLDEQVLQAKTAHYVMLNKPAGVVSATSDEQHKTVIDLLPCAARNQLHLVGRLDFNSTGLVLLTNDGRWSRRLTNPDSKLVKRYRVTLQQPLSEEYVLAFAAGMYFEYEGITTRPAGLEILSSHVAMVSLVEGRYHQIKRMFGRFQNPVLTLHRLAIGKLALDSDLALGASRDLTPREVQDIG